VRALICNEFNITRGLGIVEMPEPNVGPGQVLISVVAVGLTYLDALMVKGAYQIKAELPFIPGGEFSGVVITAGPGVDAFKKGDRVAGEIIIGALAEQIVVNAKQLVLVPDNIEFETAATILQSYSTALYALTHRIQARQGESILVLGAGSGVGLACVDVATSLGCKVIAVGSSEVKRTLAKSLGAAETIDSSVEDVKLKAREFSNNDLRIVFDPVGGAVSENSMKALGFNGKYLVIGFASGTIPAIPFNLVLLNNRQIIGVDLGADSLRDPNLLSSLNQEVIDNVTQHIYRPIPPSTVSLYEVKDAFEKILNGKINGKVAALL